VEVIASDVVVIAAVVEVMASVVEVGAAVVSVAPFPPQAAIISASTASSADHLSFFTRFLLFRDDPAKIPPPEATG
jgi:hypothetical protein